MQWGYAVSAYDVHSSAGLSSCSSSSQFSSTSTAAVSLTRKPRKTLKHTHKNERERERETWTTWKQTWCHYVSFSLSLSSPPLFCLHPTGKTQSFVSIKNLTWFLVPSLFTNPIISFLTFSFSLNISPAVSRASRFVTFFFYHDNKYIIGKRWLAPPPFVFRSPLFCQSCPYHLMFFFSVLNYTEFVLIKRCILERFGPSPILHLPWLSSFFFSYIYTHALWYIYTLSLYP
jgi:hypothetical protein